MPVLSNLKFQVVVRHIHCVEIGGKIESPGMGYKTCRCDETLA